MTQRLTPEREAEIRLAVKRQQLFGGHSEDLLAEIEALRAELAGAEERGAARERAAVAAWLEADWLDRTSSEIADCVARGDHVRTMRGKGRE